MPQDSIAKGVKRAAEEFAAMGMGVQLAALTIGREIATRSEDWENETTYFIFTDGSRIRLCALEDGVEVD